MERKPNVVLINCDDMGYGDLGCYGSRINKSPAIDKLAEEGILFTSFYCASPVCSPSRAGLMTGCLPPRVGINRVLFPGEPNGLNPSEYTLPKLFKDAGYFTMIIGKWHCGDQLESMPLSHGFHHYYGLPYSNDMGIQRRKNTFMEFPPLPLMLDNEVIEEQPDQRSITERYTEQAVRFMRTNQNNPFFLYLAHMHVHLPHYVPEHFVQESQNGDFGACVAAVDWSTATLIHELKSLGIYENTIIVFTSDNGSRGDHGASNAPLKGTKFTTYEGGMRIPFIVHWKNHIAPHINRNIGAHIDLLPTFASLIGKPLSDGLKIDGIDISEMFKDPDASPREYYTYYRHSEADLGYLDAVRLREWKLFLGREDEQVMELYNLENDVGENTNLYARYPEIVREISAVFEKYEKLLGNKRGEKQGVECRPCRIAKNPKTLTTYNESHPYIISMYDKDDVG